MCTVVVQWEPDHPLLILALRDELTGRPFDDPDEWWPDYPAVVGGRDRSAGGSWCVSDIASGATALVLNRPQRRVAEPGAPSRGLLPLLAAAHGAEWPEYVDYQGMASFALVLAAPDSLTEWHFDGTHLTSAALEPGTRMVTSGGAEDGKAARFLEAFASHADPDEWRAIVARQQPQDDPAALVVRHELGDLVYATVFGQVIESSPGALELSWSRTPWTGEQWATRRWV
ncbi:MAG: hypothetical protein QOJ92_1574 [Frankiales bacterium]|nr:hypothetical protein [Frankiales bacterium]